MRLASCIGVIFCLADRFVSSSDNLESIRQSADVLVVNKAKLLEGNVRREVCPSLTHPQLYQLLMSYTPDEFDPEPVDPKARPCSRSSLSLLTDRCRRRC